MGASDETMKWTWTGAAALTAIGALISMPVLAGSPSPKTALVSKTSAGEPANGDSRSGSISGTGRFVAFRSEAPNLPGSDTDDSIYVFDRKSGKTRLVSKNSDGEPAGGSSPAISASGRYVAFTSEAANLPGGEGFGKVYLHDRKSGRTTLVSKTSAGEPDNLDSHSARISGSGRRVSFFSTATNLPGSDTYSDDYVHDRQTKTTVLVSQTSSGQPANGDSRPDNAISASGRYVAFESEATNLPGGGTPGLQLYIRDLKTKKTRLVSKASNGDPADGFNDSPSISGSGRYVSFSSTASNLSGSDTTNADVYVHDRKTKQTRLVSKTSTGEPATGGSNQFSTSIAASGRYVAFHSEATNLGGDPAFGDVFVHDRKTGKTRLMSKTSAGDPATGGDSFLGGIAASGRFLVFSSDATNLPGTDEFRDVFRRGPLR
jgi:hypothetical protein